MKVHGKLTLLILLSGSLILTMILKAEKSSTPLAPFDHTVNANAKELVADGRPVYVQPQEEASVRDLVNFPWLQVLRKVV